MLRQRCSQPLARAAGRSGLVVLAARSGGRVGGSSGFRAKKAVVQEKTVQK